MKNPRVEDKKYWDRGSRFRHMIFIEDQKRYIDYLESEIEEASQEKFYWAKAFHNFKRNINKHLKLKLKDAPSYD